MLCMVAGIAICTHAQDTLSNKNLEEVLIYSNKFAERKKNIVQKIEVISAQRIAQVNAQTTGDLLANTGNVFVQKSQQGGASPVLRGFEASRVLLVIDGVRMNNAIYRAGHLQNVITVDQNMLERIEILYGPASTIYGSDALGGVVHMRTKLPKLSLNDTTLFTGSGFARYSSVNKEKTGHADVSIGGKKWAWLQAYNYSFFDDLKMGSHYPAKYPDFGRRTQYIALINGVDSIVKNTDDRIQKYSGYSQWDVSQKVLFQQNKKVTHLLNLQYSNSTNVPRYDRLQDERNGNLRFTQWYYGPQTRTLAAYELSVQSTGIFNDIKAILSHQFIKECRHQREYRRYDGLDNRVEKLHVVAYTIDARKLWPAHELTIGTDGQFNNVKSTAFRKNITTGAVSPLDTRYPNGSNKMNYFGLYAQHLFKFGSGKWVLNDGVRLQTTHLRSTIADNSFFNFPFVEIGTNNIALTGNVGLIYMPSADSRFTLGLSSGFRAPNIDDLSRIFESNSASRQIIIPNPNIKPEYTYNADLGLTKNFGAVRIETGTFYTLFGNAIALAAFQLNGRDSIFYNGSNAKVFANQNINKAELYGFYGNLSIEFEKQFKFFGSFNYTYGKLQPAASAKVPLDHIPPMYGRLSLTYTQAKFWAEGYVMYNGWKRIASYNPSGEDNLQYATADGTPAWTTINFKTSFSFTKKLQAQAGVENILDRNYRPFASGFSGGGRNFIVSLRSGF